MNENILNFYKQTSLFTELGFYKDFAVNLPNDIKELCLLQRMQIIHPAVFKEKDIRKQTNCFWGNMTEIPLSRIEYEDDYFPTAISMFAELLRRNPNYTKERAAKDKIQVTCRGQAILLAATLKAKGIPARARSGFASYVEVDEYWDHWITEYYDEKINSWILADADCCCNDIEDFDIYNMPRDKFLFGAEAYLAMRNKTILEEKVIYASNPLTKGMKAALRGLFYDFHSLMNNEIIFLHVPSYIKEKNFELSEEEFKELDILANLMLNPNKNFDKLLAVWNNELKFRILTGALNG